MCLSAEPRDRRGAFASERLMGEAAAGDDTLSGVAGIGGELTHHAPFASTRFWR